ncbi:uncharacterized protein LOC126972123 [Leptidea sinapis]|uniref:uncharacterized protein LOC126972123 n=1 Tax=Leptidea sinapis TaxID=189913 RepID=UPI002124EA1A|nr:uncharacterized protein LOC126972123 [Leptidea sinapis]
MSMKKTRPMDTLQRIVSSFKHFEKKIDKLQDDVNFQGHTLTELRVIVANISSVLSDNTVGKQRDLRKTSNKTATVEELKNGDVPAKNKKKIALPQNTLPKGKSSTYEEEKFNRKPGFDATSLKVKKLPSSPKQSNLPIKRSQRYRKAATLRPQKETVKKRNKTPKDQIISI